MSLESGQLLLRQDTTVTCPKCANEFSLDQGFAKKALGQPGWRRDRAARIRENLAAQLLERVKSPITSGPG